MRIAEAEIEELKQSLRYIEIQLARSREENETKQNKIMEQQQEIEKGQETLAKQLRFSQAQTRQIEELQKKVDNFTTGQKDVSQMPNSHMFIADGEKPFQGRHLHARNKLKGGRTRTNPCLADE